MQNKPYRFIALAGCLFLALGLAGCAKPRTGPFDVPAAMPSSGAFTDGSQGPLSGSAFGRGSSDVEQAAARINAAKVHFAFDRADIRPDARAALDEVAALLKRYPSIRVSIQGHCDERGPAEYNYALGERRARAAYGYLVNAGVPARQMDMVNHGEKNPAVPGRSESAFAMNRRAEFVVLTTCYRP